MHTLGWTGRRRDAEPRGLDHRDRGIAVALTVDFWPTCMPPMRSSVRGTLACVAALALCSCDGGLGAIEVNVFVRTAPGLARSQAYANAQPPSLNGIRTLDSAQVEIVESPGKRGSERTITAIASKTGMLHYTAPACACDFDVQVTVRRRGYQTVVQTFQHTGLNNVVVAWLAPAP